MSEVEKTVKQFLVTVCQLPDPIANIIPERWSLERLSYLSRREVVLDFGITDASVQDQLCHAARLASAFMDSMQPGSRTSPAMPRSPLATSGDQSPRSFSVTPRRKNNSPVACLLMNDGLLSPLRNSLSLLSRSRSTSLHREMSESSDVNAELYWNTSSHDRPLSPGSPFTGANRARTAMLYRSESAAAQHQTHSRLRRESSTSSSVLTAWSAGACAMDGASYLVQGSTTNLLKMRTMSLGQSAPQLTSINLTTSPCATPPKPASAISQRNSLRLRKDLVQRRHSHRMHRKSLHANTSPILQQRCKSPLSQNSPPVDSPRLHSIPLLRNQRQYCDTRRWSLASLPSSGYGTTPGSSALSSQYSSSEQLYAEEVAQAFDSTDSYAGEEEGCEGGGQQNYRPRSKSLNNLAWLNLNSAHFDSRHKLYESEVVLRSNLYKERFPKAKQQMETRLEQFLAENGATSLSSSSSSLQLSSNGNTGVLANTSHGFTGSTCSLSASSNSNLELMKDGSARFVHHQIMELAIDCLRASKDGAVSSQYFYDMSRNLEDLLLEAREKCPESLQRLAVLIRQLLLVVARPARLLECLEFDPEEFYELLEAAEEKAREAIAINEPIPQYIISKLGLNKRDPLHELASDGLTSSTDSGHPDTPGEHAVPGDQLKQLKLMDDYDPGRALFGDRIVPKEEDFETIKLVSNGAYGAVYLVRHRKTKHRFALKKVNKVNLGLRNQLDQVFAERDILTFADNPFVVSFYGSFETKRHLCMVLEYVEGGDCAALLKNIGVFPVDLSRLYIAETVLAIEYLHSYGVVHRDLKPDNLLITSLGHVKLTDFGLSKIGLMNRTNILYEDRIDLTDTHQFQDKQVCGTPEYIAPEVILRQGYGKPVDWWAVGIILYEFMVGVVPFFGETPEELFAHVISSSVIEWPEEPYTPPEEAQDLIMCLLQQSPLDRLGTTASGALEIKAHPFFNNVDWEGLLRQKAQFVPQLDGDEDTSYFDSRSDRYNHDLNNAALNAGDDDDDDDDSLNSSNTENQLLYESFSSSSPRFSYIADMAASRSNESSEPSTPHNACLARSSTMDDRKTINHSNPSRSVLSLNSSDFTDKIPNVKECSRSESIGSSTTSGIETGDEHVIIMQDSGEQVQWRRRRSERVLPKFSVSDSDANGGSSSSSMTTNVCNLQTQTKELSPVEERERETSRTPSTPMSTGLLTPIPSDDQTPVGSTDDNNDASSLSSSSKTSSYHLKKPMIPINKPKPPPSPKPSTTQMLKFGTRTMLSSTSCDTTDKQLQGRRSVSAQGLHLVIPNDSVPPNVASGIVLRSPGGSSCSSRDVSPSREFAPLISQLKPPIVIKRGRNGYGFTLRAIPVYIGDSNVYMLQHIVQDVESTSPAYEAGLRSDDLITEVNGEPIQNQLHSEVVKLILRSLHDQLTLRVTSLENTSIRRGTTKRYGGKRISRRRTVAANGTGKRIAKKSTVDKKRRHSALLLRRLSGKREGGAAAAAAHYQRRYATSGNSVAAVSPLSRSISTNEQLHGSQIATTSSIAACTTEEQVSPPVMRIRSESSSNSSSPASSISNSPAGTSCGGSSTSQSNWLQSRPSSLYGLGIPKMGKSPRTRKQSNTMPLSPLARSDPVPVTTVSSTPYVSTMPARSPSPLAAGCILSHGQHSGSVTCRTSSTVSNPLNVATAAVGGGVPVMSSTAVCKKTITRPRKSDPGGSPLLRRALSPTPKDISISERKFDYESTSRINLKPPESTSTSSSRINEELITDKSKFGYHRTRRDSSQSK